MFWRMIGRTLVRQKSKMLMIAFTVVLGVSLSTQLEIGRASCRERV